MGIWDTKYLTCIQNPEEVSVCGDHLVLSQLNPLSANPTKWSNALKQFVGFHFAGLALKELSDARATSSQ